MYQVDPLGKRSPKTMTMGNNGKAFESFAHDIRDKNNPRFFATVDAPRGALHRFTPSDVDWNDPWNMLHGSGTMEYLLLNPSKMTFSWTTDRGSADNNSGLYYRHSEGIDVYKNELFFVCKEQKELFILDLDNMTYEKHSTRKGIFDGQPDQMKRLLTDDGKGDLLYFCEEGGSENGVHARDSHGWFFTILESAELNDETTGLDFSPDGKHMYVSYQHNGIIFDVYREDGLSFHAKTLNVKYHEVVA